MKVYRLLIDSAKRQPGGHEYNFELDISGLITTARDLKGYIRMVAIEWNKPVKYSDVSPTFEKRPTHPAAIFLTCPTLSQYNTWESGPALRPAPLASCRDTRDTAITDVAQTLSVVARRLCELSSKATG
jgi:hypothetical protein